MTCLALVFLNTTADCIDNVYPVLTLKGVPAVASVYSDLPGSWTGYLTWSEMATLAADNWEIISCGLTYNPYITNELTEEEWETELRQSREMIEARGLTVESFMPSNLEDNATARQYVRKYYRSSISVATTNGINKSLPDAFNLYARHCSTSTAAQLKASIDVIAAQSYPAIWYFHSMPTDNLDMEDFEEVVDYAITAGLTLCTVKDILDELDTGDLGSVHLDADDSSELECLDPPPDYPYSLSVWFRWDEDNLSGYDFIAGWNGDSAKSRMLLAIDSATSKLCMYARIDPTSWIVTAGDALSPGVTWHHAVLVRNSATSGYCYLDGTKSAEMTTDLSALKWTGAYLEYGAIGTIRRFTGSIAHCAVYDKALSDAEVTSLLTLWPYAVAPDNLYRYYNFASGPNSHLDIGPELTVNYCTGDTDGPTLDDSPLTSYDVDVTEINLVGTVGERLHGEFVVTANEDITSLTVSVDSDVDVRIERVWYQAGYDILDVDHKHLRAELLLHDPNLVYTDKTTNFKSYLYDSSTDPAPQYRSITDADATLPDTLVIEDAETIQPCVDEAALQTGDEQKFWIFVTGAESTSYTLTISDGSLETEIKINITIKEWKLKPKKIFAGLYYTQWLNSTNPDPLFSDRHVVSTTRMAAELAYMRLIGIDYPAYYHDNYNSVETTKSLRIAAGFPDHTLFSVVNTDGSEAIVRAKCQTLKTHFPDSDDIYLYGPDEALDQTSYIPNWEIVHDEGCKVWSALPLVAIAGVASVLDVGNVWNTDNEYYPADPEYAALFHAHNNRAAFYNVPQLGEDRKKYTIRRSYGFGAYVGDFDGIFPYCLYDIRTGMHPWLDWSNVEEDIRPCCCVYPTTEGIIPTVQSEYLADAIVDLQYIATLEYWISQDPTSTEAIAGQEWLDGLSTELEAATTYAALCTLRTEAIELIDDLYGASGAGSITTTTGYFDFYRMLFWWRSKPIIGFSVDSWRCAKMAAMQRVCETNEMNRVADMQVET